MFGPRTLKSAFFSFLRLLLDFGMVCGMSGEGSTKHKQVTSVKKKEKNVTSHKHNKSGSVV
jgi:hypothetical protein